MHHRPTKKDFYTVLVIVCEVLLEVTKHKTGDFINLWPRFVQILMP